MSQSTVFINNRSQAVRIPAEMRFADDIKVVTVRALGHERIISPAGHTWDSFFFSDEHATDDFMDERPSQE
ncbi:type II toxin-antitoxin system VapB family antitoxin [Acerihabitans sp.]